MRARRARGGLALVFASAAVGWAGCRSPTQITIVITTSADCAMVDDTAILVGNGAADVEKRDPATITSTCDTGRIGSVVIIPGGNRQAPLALKIVTGVGVLAEDCLKGAVPNVPGADKGCIYARRELGFIPQTPLSLPIVMHKSCIGVDCGEGMTCVEGGGCVSAVIGDPSKCAAAGGCEDSTLPPAGTGGAPGTGGTGGMTSSSSSSGGTGGMASSSGGTGGMASSSSGTGGSSSSSTSSTSSSSSSTSSTSTSTSTSSTSTSSTSTSSTSTSSTSTSSTSTSSTSTSSTSTSTSSTSTSSTSTSTGTTTTMCTVVCTPPNECYAADCVGSTCNTPPQPFGWPCMNSTGQCDGAGTCQPYCPPDNCMTPPGPCFDPGTCTFGGCMFMYSPPGTSCPGGTCDGTGICNISSSGTGASPPTSSSSSSSGTTTSTP